MREGGGHNMSVFVHAQGIKTVHAGGGQKMAKFCPRSCCMPPYLAWDGEKEEMLSMYVAVHLRHYHGQQTHNEAFFNNIPISINWAIFT